MATKAFAKARPKLFRQAGPLYLASPIGSRILASMVGRGMGIYHSKKSEAGAGNGFMRHVNIFYSNYFGIQDIVKQRYLQIDPNANVTANTGACLAVCTWDEVRMVDPAWPDADPSITFLLRDGFTRAWQEVEWGHYRNRGGDPPMLGSSPAA